MKTFRNIIFAMMIAGTLSADLYTLSSDSYLFGLAKHLPVLNSVNLFDGPYSVSNAATTPATTIKPTLKQMKYYNYYAGSMYCPYELDDLTCEYCEKFEPDVDEHTVIRNDVHNTIALITLSKCRKEIVITYRGTMNAWNVILDVLMINGGRDDIKIHRGFLMATMSLYDEVVACVGYLRSLRKLYSTYKIVVCGHSLGGAMARVTQYFLHSLNQFDGVKIELYTYGEPRSGNKAYADYLNSLSDVTARVVARADIASHCIPTSILSLPLLGDPYLHVQTEYFIDGEDGQRFCNHSVYEDRACSMSLGPLYSIVDHLTYFDVDILSCFAGNPLAVSSLPLGLFEPTKILPPLPEPISDFTGGLSHFGVTLLSPLLG